VFANARVIAAHRRVRGFDGIGPHSDGNPSGKDHNHPDGAEKRFNETSADPTGRSKRLGAEIIFGPPSSGRQSSIIQGKREPTNSRVNREPHRT
jgi:hypothetical protein